MFADFRSRHIPYKNVCLICQFALCLPGRESGGLPPELPSDSRNGAARPLPELRRQSSGRSRAASLRDTSGSSGRSLAVQLREYNPFLLHVTVQSGIQSVKTKVPLPKFLLNQGQPRRLRVFTCCGSTRDVRHSLNDS